MPPSPNNALFPLNLTSHLCINYHNKAKCKQTTPLQKLSNAHPNHQPPENVSSLLGPSLSPGLRAILEGTLSTGPSVHNKDMAVSHISKFYDPISKPRSGIPKHPCIPTPLFFSSSPHIHAFSMQLFLDFINPINLQLMQDLPGQGAK